MDELRGNVEALGLQVRQVAGDNPALRRTTAPFTFPKYGCPKLQELRRRFGLASVVKNEDELADILQLAKWVNTHMRLHQRGRCANILDPIEILEVAGEGKAAFWCTHYMIAFNACAASLGLAVRPIGVDSRINKDDEFEDTHHGTCEAYSSKFRKWFVVDPLHGMYFVKDGIPLNAYDLACEWQADQGRSVRIIGLDGQEMERCNQGVVGERHVSSAYHFFYIHLVVDPFPGCGGGEPARRLYFEDEARRNTVWYVGKPKYRQRHPGYGESFIHTDRLDDVYFDVNIAHISTRAIPPKHALGVSFETYTPNLSHFLYRVGDGAWRRFSGKRPWKEEEARFFPGGGEPDAPADLGHLQQNEVLWKIHRGRNTFAVKPVNRFGREGGVSYLETEVG